MHLHQHQNIHHQFAPSSASPAGGSTIASSPCMPVNHTSTQRRPSSPTPRSSWQTEAIYFLLACSLSLGLPLISFLFPSLSLVWFGFLTSLSLSLSFSLVVSSSLPPFCHPRTGRGQGREGRGKKVLEEITVSGMEEGKEGGRKGWKRGERELDQVFSIQKGA